MAGSSVSFVDFYLDAARGFPEALRKVWDDVAPQQKRILAAIVALSPPLFFAAKYQGAFLGALENAGVIGGVSLYGLIPAIMVWRARSREELKAGTVSAGQMRVMPGRLEGGDAFLGLVVVTSISLVLPEAVRIIGSLFK
jgi:hypothetical protein